MTMFGGGELSAPDYEGGSLLLMPSLYYDDWGILDMEAKKTLIAALRVSGSIAGDRRVPLLSQATAKIVEFIRVAEGAATAQAKRQVEMSGDVPGKSVPRRIVDLFPRALTSQNGVAPPAGAKKTIWELYGYGQKVFDEIQQSAQGAFGSFDGLENLDYNERLASRLFQEFEVVKFRDASDQVTPETTNPENRVVDLGCDLKLLLTWLSAVGPVNCEIGAGADFGKLKREGSDPPPASKVRACVPSPPSETPREEYVTVVASRGEGSGRLRDVIIEVERANAAFDAQYLIRRTDEEGKTMIDWGDGGHAWISHADLRRTIRWARAVVPANFLETPSAAP